MIPVLEQKFPNAKIIALHVNDPESESILENNLLNIDPLSIKIIEWRPAMNYYKEAYVKLLSLAVNYIKRLDAEKRTVSAFGMRWVRNFFRNLKNVRSTLLYKETDIPVIITGSGPSLETALPVIKEAQNRCLIIAAASSVMALTHYGIKPDLVIATDGGCWALKHLYSLYREHGTWNGAQRRLALNLCAALPSQCSETPQLILNDGSLWQSVVLHELQLPSVFIPQRGTVTASAVDLALLLTTGNIYLGGLDLSIQDIRTHVKPYAFDCYLLEKTNRFSSFYSQSFMRSRLMKEGGSMDIYAKWFKGQYDKWPKRIFDIKEEPSRRGAIESSIRAKRKEDFFKAVPINSKKDGIDILINNLNNDIKKDLEPLIGEDIENFISSLRHCASARGVL